MMVSLAFFRLDTLNLRVDSCMFEKRFPMLTEGSRSESSLLFFLGTTMSEGLFFAGLLYFSLKQRVFQRTMAFHIGLCRCDLCLLLVCIHSVLCIVFWLGVSCSV
jgi:hypothetical protein